MGVLAQMAWGQWFIAAVLIGVCCFLMLVILLQRGRGGGLTGAFGGAGGSSAFGAKTGDVFTWITVVVATIFVVLAVLANYSLDESAPARVSAAPPSEQTAPIPLPEGTITPGSVSDAPGFEGPVQTPGEVPPGEAQLDEGTEEQPSP